MNITKHCLQRYLERFKGINKQDFGAILQDKKELYETELNKMISNATMIYTGTFNENNQMTNYWIADNIILVTDIANTKIITLYRIEFGFDREIDKTILSNLKGQLEDADIKYIQAMEEVKEKKDKLDNDSIIIKEQIKSLEEQLKSMKSGLKGIEEYKRTITIDEMKAKTKRDIIAKKIIYSNIYKNAVDEYAMDL